MLQRKKRKDDDFRIRPEENLFPDQSQTDSSNTSSPTGVLLPEMTANAEPTMDTTNNRHSEGIDEHTLSSSTETDGKIAGDVPNPRDKKKSMLPQNPWRKSLKYFGLFFLIVISLVTGFGIYFSRDLPSIAQLEVYEPKLSTRIYSSDGKIIREFFKERRTRIPFKDIPQPVIQALLATEDHRFYSHWGVDLIRAVKASMVNLSTFSSKEGFSSLTQQLAKNLYLSSEKTLARKFKEILTAIQIERTYAKNEIIEMYLTHMYFGRQAYGIHSASRIYFNKEVKDLTLAETAYLIGLLQAPSYYAGNPKAGEMRKRVVLRRMRECEYISESAYAGAAAQPIVWASAKEREDVGSAPYFTDYVRQQLEAMQDSLKFNLYEDGLRVYTTLNTRLQTIAEKALEQSVKEKFSGLDKFGAKVIKSNYRFYLRQYLMRDGFSQDEVEKMLSRPRTVDSLCALYGTVQVGFVAMDPANGFILAMIGGRNYREHKLNHVTQIRRQPGSTFKPFLYTVAIDNGYAPSFKVLNQDVVLMMEDGTRWTPQNYDGSRSGPTTLRDALARSLNLVSVRLMQEVVPVQEVVKLAGRMGLTTPMAPVDALALGVSDVIPLEIVSAYAVFANKGVRTEPVSILKIEDKEGNLIWQYTPKRKEVLSPATAYLMTDMMKSGIEAERGTGRFAKRYGFDRPAAVKTGTTQKWTDGWFIGYTPQIVAGVWVGFDAYEFNLGSKNPGAIVASPLWGRFMAEAHKALNLPVEDFEMPPDVVRMEICDETGLLANPLCPQKTMEVFRTRYQPTEFCNKHTGNIRTTKKKKSGRY